MIDEESDHHSIAAEQQLLGALMVNNDAYVMVSDIVTADQFFEPIHRTTYDVISQIIGVGKRATPATVVPYFPPNQDIGGMTVRQYIARLCAEATTTINAPDFARTIRDLSDIRRVKTVGQLILEARATDPAELASEAVDELDDVITSRSAKHIRVSSMANVMDESIKAAANAYQNRDAPAGIMTGLRDLDRKLGGMEGGQVITVAGRPGSGKSTAGACITRNMGERGKKVRFHSLEMPTRDMGHRMLADQLYDERKIDYSRFRSGNLHDSDFGYMMTAAESLKMLPITIDPQRGLTLAQIGARARMQQRRSGLDMLMIDHLGQLKASARYSGNRHGEISEIMKGIQILAADLNVPVILFSQLNRTVETRENKRPMLSDLRESGSIEEDSDVVIFLYREAYYLERSQPVPGTDAWEKWQTQMDASINQIEIIVAKQRMGPIGTVEAYCDMGSNVIRDKGYVPSRHIPPADRVQQEEIAF